jgi:uncharacterized membrane protein
VVSRTNNFHLLKERFTVIRALGFVLLGLTIVISGVSIAQEKSAKEEKPAKKGSDVVSFKDDVFPIIQKHCLPCHAEENFNPSELSMDNYDLLSAGGKSGPAFVPKKSSESLIVQKLGEKPPSGDRMPLNSKKKIQDGKAVWLTKEEVKTIATWVDQGAKKN